LIINKLIKQNEIIWKSATEFIEKQTVKIAKEFKTSNPRPRNKVMGFKGNDRPKRKY